MKRILRLIVIAVALFLAYAATRPNTFHIERSASIAAPPETVYPHVANFREWTAWSPWEKLDPNMKREFGGTDGAVGASYAWAGNDKAGEGKMTITEAVPASRIGIRLDFLKPFKSTSMTAWTFTPDGAGTNVRWTMDGDKNFLSKVMCIFMDMDKMVGGDFERGLVSLKAVSEGAATGL